MIREDISKLGRDVRLGQSSVEDGLYQAYLLGLQAYQEQLTEPVFRVLDQLGAPVDSRVWSRPGPAKLALRHSYKAGTVQAGKVTWE